MDKNNFNGQLLTAMLGGVVMGVVAAVLYAPESRKINRSKIKRGVARASNNLASATAALSKNA